MKRKYKRTIAEVFRALNDLCNDAKAKGPLATQWFKPSTIQNYTGLQIEFVRESLQHLYDAQKVERRHTRNPTGFGGYITEWRVK